MKKHLLTLSLLGVLALVGCSVNEDDVVNTNTGSAYDYNQHISVDDPIDIVASETDKEFALTTSDGEYVNENNIYSIRSSGTYTLSGKLEGRILIEAGEDDEVVLELDGVTISYDSDSGYYGDEYFRYRGFAEGGQTRFKEHPDSTIVLKGKKLPKSHW